MNNERYNLKNQHNYHYYYNFFASFVQTKHTKKKDTPQYLWCVFFYFLFGLTTTKQLFFILTGKPALSKDSIVTGSNIAKQHF